MKVPKITTIKLTADSLPDEYKTHLYETDKTYTEPIYGEVEVELKSSFEKILGHSGYLLSASKSYYSNKHPGHQVFFNACIFDKNYKEVWYGDLDITKEADKLQAVADKLGKFYVTREQPFRWNGIKPFLDKKGNVKDEYYKDSILIFESNE